MKCLKCGKTYDDKQNFCPVCGEKNKIMEEPAITKNNSKNVFNRVFDIIGRKTSLSFICIVAGGLLVFIFMQMAIMQSCIEMKILEMYDATDAIVAEFVYIPKLVDLSKYLCIFVFIVSIVNAIRKKDENYTLISSLSAMNTFALLVNSKTIKALSMLVKGDDSSLHNLIGLYDKERYITDLLANPQKLVYGVQGELAVGIFFLIASVVMFIFFFKQQRKHNNTVSCTKCARILETDMKFCPSCGEPVIIETPKNHCKNCGEEFEKDMNFCPNCGTKVINLESPENQLIEDTNVNKEDASRLKRCLTKISSGKMTTISGIITGICIIVMICFVVNLKSLESMNELPNVLKAFPGIYYCTLCFAIFTCLISIVNVVYHKDSKTLIIAVLSGIETLLLVVNFNILSLYHDFSSFLLKKIFEYSAENYLYCIKIIRKLMIFFDMAMVCGILILIFSIVLFIIFINKSQEVYKRISIESLKDLYFKNFKCSVKSLQDNQLKKANKKQKVIGVIVVALIVALISGYNVWNNHSTYTKIDLTKHLKVSFSGDSGYAQAYIDENPIEYDKSNKQIAQFVDDISYHFSRERDLYNGEIVTVTLIYNKVAAKMLKLKVVNTSKKIKVSGLEYNYYEDL